MKQNWTLSDVRFCENEGSNRFKINEKVSGFTFIVGNCYLAPYNSIYGNISTEFVAHLITQLYLNSEVDSIYVCGDYNAKIGNLTDVMEDIDINWPPRISIDDVIHGHREAMIDFLKDSKMCILNGRLRPENDNFTYLSDKGRSVVDYIVTPHDCLKTVFHLIYIYYE